MMISHRDIRWQAANFVTPHWYRRDLVGNHEQIEWVEREFGFGLDWARRLSTPGEIGPFGYAVLRERLPGGGEHLRISAQK